MIDAPISPAARFESLDDRRGRPRLIICDDHRVVVDMLSKTLGDDCDIVGVALDGETLLDVVRRCPADCLLLDLLLPKHDGIELIPRVRALQPSMRILVVTMVLDRRTAAAAFRAGAHGYFPKDASWVELRHAIHEVLAGRRYLSPRVPKNTRRVGLRALLPALCNLTARQEQVLVMMGEGKSETAIAHQLGVSPTAITFHKQKLARVLGVESEASLKHLAFMVREAIGTAPAGGPWRALQAQRPDKSRARPGDET